MPLSGLITGFLSFFKQWWIGLIPILTLSIIYLFVDDDIYFLGVCISTMVFGLCKAINVFLSLHQRKKISEYDKARIYDL